MSNYLASLTENEKKVMHIMLRYPGMSASGIARQLDFSVDAVLDIQKDPHFAEVANLILAKTHALTDKAQELALRRIISILLGPNDKLALEASKIVLFPLLARPQIEAGTEKVIFKTRIGDGGEIQREMIIDAHSEDSQDGGNSHPPSPFAKSEQDY